MGYRFVGPFLARKVRGTDNAPTYTNVYVKNLAPSVTSEDLQKLFSPFGQITSCAVMQNENNESKGFGFVNFELADAAHEV